MAKSVAQTPDVGHLIHLENELSVPSTLADREVGRIPEASTVRRVEVGGQRVDVVAITRFVAHRIVEFEEMLKRGESLTRAQEKEKKLLEPVARELKRAQGREGTVVRRVSVE